jgi:hypothetical protein
MIVDIRMVRTEDFEKVAAAADKGVKNAREFILAFLHWNNHFEGIDERPHCFSCDAVIHQADDLDDDEPGNMAGFGFAKVGKEGAEETEGFGGPFCSACERKGPDELCERFAKMVEGKLGAAAMTVH